MSQEIRAVTLETLADGAAAEQFQEEWAKVLRNIAEPNADAKKIRRITITVQVKPDEDRRLAAVSVNTTSKLAPTKARGTAVHLFRQKGELVATEYNPAQLDLPMNEHAESRTAPTTGNAAPVSPAPTAEGLRAVQGGKA